MEEQTLKQEQVIFTSIQLVIITYNNICQKAKGGKNYIQKVSKHQMQDLEHKVYPFSKAYTYLVVIQGKKENISMIYLNIRL